MLRALALSGVGFILLTGNAVASDRELFPEVVGAQTLTYDAGTAWIVNPGAVSIAASVTPADRSSIWLGLIVQNRRETPVTVREQDISANFGAAKLKVWNASELAEQQHRKGNWRKALAGLAAGLNSYAAGQSGRYSTTGTFNGSLYSSGSLGYQNSTFSGSYAATGTDPVTQQRAVEAAAQQNQVLLSRVQQQGELDEQSINAFVFHSQTVPSGGVVFGHLKIDVPSRSSRPQPIVIMVNAEGDHFAFFVGLDGPYDAAQRANAAQIYELVRPQAIAANTTNLSGPNTNEHSDSAQETPPAETTTSEHVPAQAAQRPRSSVAERCPRAGDPTCFPMRPPRDKHQPAGSAPTTQIATASDQRVNANTTSSSSAFLVSVAGKRLEPCPSDMAKTCVVIDLVWEQPSVEQLVVARSGSLVLKPKGSQGQELGLEWNVPDALVAGKTIEQHGVEFALGKAGAATEWLSTIDATSIDARFVSATSH